MEKVTKTNKSYTSRPMKSTGRSGPVKKPNRREPAKAAHLREKLPIPSPEGRKQKREVSAQQSIPYLEMSPGGICRVDENTYSKTIRFEDINYQLSKEDEQRHIFAGWCDFLNYFDSSIDVQISFINHRSSMEEFQKMIEIPKKEDGQDDLRQEYAEMLKRQLSLGHNGVVKDRYITFSIHADSLQEAAPKLRQIEGDIRRNFKGLGVPSRTLTGEERLKIFYETFHPEDPDSFRFSWDDLAMSGLTTKDYIAPTSFTFKDGRYSLIGQTPCAASFLDIQASQLRDDLLSQFLEIDANLIVNLHIRSVEQNEAVKQIRRKVSELDSRKIEEQKRAVRSGYDMEILPADLTNTGQEAKHMLSDLQTRNERMFLVSVLFLNMENSKKDLDNVILQMQGIAQSGNCLFKRLDYRQEKGLFSSIPLGKNFVNIDRFMTTTSTSGFIPFTTQELFMGGESLYYGLNAVSENMIMADRKKLKAPNGLILGTPGSGKSFAAKREITYAFFRTDDDILICDPEGEYYPLVQALGGQIIRLSSGSRNHINPMDFNVDYGGGESDSVNFKSDFLMSLCELIMHSRGGLLPKERTFVNLAVTKTYEKYLLDPRPENMPTLKDFSAALKAQPNDITKEVGLSVDLYASGSIDLFSRHTDVQLNNRIVCFDISSLDNTLRNLAMFVIQDQVWNRVTRNRAQHRTTRYYQDEFHILLNQEQTAEYCVQIWKRFRKWGGIPTGITQNVNDLRTSPQVNNIFENSDFVMMLNQRGEDQAMLAQTLGISEEQMKHVTWSEEGEGLLYFGNTILPFKDRLPSDSKLYRLITTKPEDLKKMGKNNFST